MQENICSVFLYVNDVEGHCFFFFCLEYHVLNVYNYRTCVFIQGPIAQSVRAEDS